MPRSEDSASPCALARPSQDQPGDSAGNLQSPIINYYRRLYHKFDHGNHPILGWFLQLGANWLIHALSWCFRIQGLGGFHPVPLYTLGTIQIVPRRGPPVQSKYQGLGDPPSPRPLKHQLSPCVVHALLDERTVWAHPRNSWVESRFSFGRSHIFKFVGDGTRVRPNGAFIE